MRRRPKLAYLDTNFFSYLKKKPGLADRALAYLRSEGLTVIISTLHGAELHGAYRQHDAIGRFWDDAGAKLVAPSGHTNYVALDAYPRVKRRPPRIIGPTCAEVAQDFLAGIPVQGSISGYSAAVLSDQLSAQQPNARDVIEKIRGRVDPTNRRDFEDRWILDALVFTTPTRLHPNFLKLDLPLVPGSFPSLRLQAALVWWTHIRAPSPKFQPSELGDRGHSEYFYCCDLIVLERFQHEQLRQLRYSAPELFKPTLKTFATSDFVRLLEPQSSPPEN